MTRKTLTTLSILSASTLAVAQENATVKSLSVFKNGQSFVVKEIKAQVPDSGYRLTTLPQALYGTYWFSGISSPVIRVNSRMEESTETKERKANSFLELLHANKGKELTIITNDNNTYKGVVEDMDLPEEINSKLQLQQMELSNTYQGQYSFDRVFIPTTPVLLLKMAGKWVGIEPATIKTITFQDKPNRTTAAHIAVQKPVVTVHFDKSGTQSFAVMYLQNGLSWVPTYQLQLASETEATLSLQAELSNNVEDIRNTDMDVVIGVPNFSQATGLATLLNFTRSGQAFGSRDLYSNAVQAISANTRDRAYEADASFAEETAPANSTAVENEDLYFYKLKNISLQKGERAQFPIFNKPVRIRHFYKSILPPSTMNTYRAGITTDESGEGNADAPEDAVDPKLNKVMHYVQVYNNTENPFTSGPILVLQKNTQSPVAQDILKFIPKGASTPVFITIAPDVLVKESEKITALKKDAKTHSNGYKYSLATVQGTITVSNSKSKGVNLQVQKSIWGTPVNATVKYEQSLNTDNRNDVNQNRRLDFDVEIPAGQKKTIRYTYQLYIQQ